MVPPLIRCTEAETELGHRGAELVHRGAKAEQLHLDAEAEQLHLDAEAEQLHLETEAEQLHRGAEAENLHRGVGAEAEQLPRGAEANLVLRGAEGEFCLCTVCEIAKQNLTPGQFRGKSKLTEKHWNLIFPHKEYPKQNTIHKKAPPVESRCTACNSVIGKGRSHKCTKQEMRKNLHNIVKKKSIKTKEKIGAKIIKEIFDDKKVNRRGGTVLLSTGGRKLPVTLSMKPNKRRFSHEHLKRLQVILGKSDLAIRLVI